MGCDIHLYTERKRSINNADKWVNIDHFKMNPYHEKDDDSEREFELCSVYDDRNYNLFSILADVRNYGENNYIDQPKGLPKDCCRITKKASEDWGCDGHSHSYFTLKELKEFNKKEIKIKVSGMISPDQLQKLEKGETPELWCRGTNQKDYVQRKWEIKDESLSHLIEKLEHRKWDEFWMFGQEEETSENDGEFRIVFWFDN